jgi:hypothetical protein
VNGRKEDRKEGKGNLMRDELKGKKGKEGNYGVQENKRRKGNEEQKERRMKGWMNEKDERTKDNGKGKEQSAEYKTKCRIE